MKKGKESYNWNDVSPSYWTVHAWLKNNYSADKKKCEMCGGTKYLQFALKRGETHSHHREKYMILCRPCHTEYDHKEKGSKISRTKKKNRYKILLNSGTLSASDADKVRKLIEK